MGQFSKMLNYPFNTKGFISKTVTLEKICMTLYVCAGFGIRKVRNLIDLLLKVDFLHHLFIQGWIKDLKT